MLTAELSRQEKAALAGDMRQRGLLYAQIASELGISRSYASQLVNDPTNELDRFRKKKYQGVCMDCGSPTDGSNGYSAQPQRCKECAHKHQIESARWNKETVLEGLRKYADYIGRQPLSSELLYERPGPWCPSVSMVLIHWGSWSAAMAELGYESRTGIKILAKQREGMAKGMAAYMLLEQNGTGGWHERGEAIGATQADALRKYLQTLEDGEEGKAGRYLCVPMTMFHPRRVRLVMKPTLETIRDF